MNFINMIIDKYWNIPLNILSTIFNLRAWLKVSLGHDSANPDVMHTHTEYISPLKISNDMQSQTHLKQAVVQMGLFAGPCNKAKYKRPVNAYRPLVCIAKNGYLRINVRFLKTAVLPPRR